MRGWWGRRSRRIGVGLHLEDQGVEWVVLEGGGSSGPALRGSGFIALPQAAVADGRICDGEAVAVAVREGLTRCGVRQATVTLSLPARSVMLSRWPLARGLGPEALQAAARREVSQRLQVDEAALAVDCGRNGSPQGPVLWVAAARVDRVRERVELAEAVGLEPVAVEADAQASWRALQRWRRQRLACAESGAAGAAGARMPMVAEVGRGATRVTFWGGQRAEGGWSATAGLAGPHPGGAEPMVSFEGGCFDWGQSREHRGAVPSVRELLRWLDHLRAAAPGEGPDGVLLCGVPWDESGLAAFTRQCGAPVSVIDPLEGIAQPGPAGRAVGLTACGLALRCLA